MSQLPDHHIPVRKPVTLPRVFGIEEGRGYTTIELQHAEDRRGEHIRDRVKKRGVRRAR